MTAEGKDRRRYIFRLLRTAEEAMQKVMDQYAGGIATNYQYNEEELDLADEKILNSCRAEKIAAADMHELMILRT